MAGAKEVTSARGGEAARDDESSPSARGTSVNVALAALFSLGVTALMYAVVLWFPKTYLFVLFCERSWCQHVTVSFFFWGLAILGLKWRCIREEWKALDEEVLPMEAGHLIRQEDALQHIRRLKRLSPQQKGRMLTSRVWRALVRFKLLGSAEKVDDLLKYQGEIDAADVESSYNFPRFLIAIVPILGFLGTVIGISDSVNGFSGVIGATNDLDQIKDALSQVTIGLATAFDTTLLAMVMSAILMFGLTVIQRWEETLLSRIEDYCLGRILDRLWVPPAHEQLQAVLLRCNAELGRELAAAIGKPGGSAVSPL